MGDFDLEWKKTLLSNTPNRRGSDRTMSDAEMMIIVILFVFLHPHRGAVTGISYNDTTKIQVFHNKRISRNKVFKNLVKRGKRAAGWLTTFDCK